MDEAGCCRSSLIPASLTSSSVKTNNNKRSRKSKGRSSEPEQKHCIQIYEPDEQEPWPDVKAGAAGPQQSGGREGFIRITITSHLTCCAVIEGGDRSRVSLSLSCHRLSASLKSITDWTQCKRKTREERSSLRNYYCSL